MPPRPKKCTSRHAHTWTHMHILIWVVVTRACTFAKVYGALVLKIYAF